MSKCGKDEKLAHKLLSKCVTDVLLNIRCLAIQNLGQIGLQMGAFTLKDCTDYGF